MGIQKLVLLQIILVSIATAQTLPGCEDQETCGNVIIPYPFGTREGCYYNTDFLITCNDPHYSPPVAFLRHSNIIVKEISLDGQLYILLLKAIDCFNNKSEIVTNVDSWVNLKEFTVSSTRNKFTTVGCDTYGWIEGTRDNKKNYGTVCGSKCESNEYIVNGTCSGIGCCQTSIPKGLRNINVTVASFNKHTSVWNFSPCSYAFIVQEDKFNFSTSYLRDLMDKKRLPVVLDWTIGNNTCEVAEQNSIGGYACKSTNSTCVNADSGYNCNCSTGYRGNPYIPDGCKDIDECKDRSLNDCKHKCNNIGGSYTCACREGYHGDGRKSGEGCSPDESLLIKIVGSIRGWAMPGWEDSWSQSLKAS